MVAITCLPAIGKEHRRGPHEGLKVLTLNPGLVLQWPTESLLRLLRDCYV